MSPETRIIITVSASTVIAILIASTIAMKYYLTGNDCEQWSKDQDLFTNNQTPRQENYYICMELNGYDERPKYTPPKKEQPNYFTTKIPERTPVVISNIPNIEYCKQLAEEHDNIQPHNFTFANNECRYYTWTARQ